MELDQRNLQFLFNVISFTGIASFAPICYLLKRDNQGYGAQRNPPPELDRHCLNLPPSLPPAVSVPEPETPIQKEPEVSTDIRQYVMHRAHSWVAPSASQWNGRLDGDSSK
jgi:hypothetical protein